VEVEELLYPISNIDLKAQTIMAIGEKEVKEWV
jgi:hypothetical protein